ncbi:TPA: cell surface protein [Streptococcus suis]|nr:cell surface protein [Streptococcus suis]
MKTKHYVAGILLSSTLLSAGFVQAEEVSTDTTTPIEEVTVPIEVPIIPAEPTEPIEGTDSSDVPIVEEPTVPIEEPGKTEEEVKPIEPPTTDVDTTPTQPTKPIEEKPVPPKEEIKEEPKEKPAVPTPTEEVKQAEENTGVSTTGEAQPITIPTIETPIVTNTGYTVLSTEESQVIVQTPTGIAKKRPEEIGAVKQSDGTVALKTDTGELKVLPATGAVENVLLFFLGIGLGFGTVVYFFKDKIIGLYNRLKK